MIVAPAPVCLLIMFLQPGEVLVLVMVLFGPHPIRPVFVIVPVMFVVMGSIVINTIVVIVVMLIVTLVLVIVAILREHNPGRDRDGRYQSGGC